MLTKHDQILQHIEGLPVGYRISVRQIAKQLGVSEGTAYRAIKEAEGQGMVSTIERVGTVRIERKQRRDIDRLTFAEVVNIVDGSVLGGRGGLHKTLHKFVIGAMELEAMMKYVESGSLMIVGNRQEVHVAALEMGAAVLVTGGFTVSARVTELADRLELPVISSTYDTFSVASMINRAIYDRLIKKDILLVEDILGSQVPSVLYDTQTVGDYRELVGATGHSRFPVLREDGKLTGVIAAKDVYGQDPVTLIARVMTRQPISVTPKTSVASAAHLMVWEGLELLPVIEFRRLVGVISRQDVIRALQYNQKQPQMGETLEDVVLSRFSETYEEQTLSLAGEVTPQMSTTHGGLSPGAFMTIVGEAGMNVLRRHRDTNMLIENATLYFLKPVQIDQRVEARARVVDVGRKMGKVDVELFRQSDWWEKRF
ncbi:DRTGG domain-containing protein [Ferroacidibacillus organovorans]|uniref:DRTGG domain-containing protein n=1 Tax=Ferroacidibacillus organovorans TaxID=1765683 RepID=UPI000A401FF8